MDDSAPDRPEDPSVEAPSRFRRVLHGIGFAVLVAVTSWLFGHLPWVLAGFSWPTTQAAPVGSSSEGLAGVRLTIPLVAAFLPSLIAFTTVGAVAASLLPLVLTTRSGPRRAAVVLALVSLTLTTIVVTMLARSTIRQHAGHAFAGDSRVLLGLVLVVFGSTAVGGLLGTLASLQVGLLPLAAGLAAGQLPTWIDGFLVERRPAAGTVSAAAQAGHVVVLVVLAVAFVLSVRRTPAWIVLWPVAIALVWVAAPFQVATVQLAGRLRPSSGLPGALPQILGDGSAAFRAAFWAVPQARWPWIAAVLIALLWMAAERALRRRGEQARR